MTKHLKHAQKSPGVAASTKAKLNIIRASVPADKSSVTLEMLPESGAFGNITLTPHGLSLLIETLSRVRAVVAEPAVVEPTVAEPTVAAPAPAAPAAGQTIKAVFDPRWQVAPALQGEATTFTFQHPAHGLLSFAVPIAQVETMIEALSRQVEAAAASKRRPPN